MAMVSNQETYLNVLGYLFAVKILLLLFWLYDHRKKFCEFRSWPVKIEGKDKMEKEKKKMGKHHKILYPPNLCFGCSKLVHFSHFFFSLLILDYHFKAKLLVYLNNGVKGLISNIWKGFKWPYKVYSNVVDFTKVKSFIEPVSEILAAPFFRITSWRFEWKGSSTRAKYFGLLRQRKCKGHA